MKFLLAFLSITSTVAFVMVAPTMHTTSSSVMRTTPTTKLYSTRPDATTAIQSAMEASKKFGSTSPEARLAWEAVEEMDASDNSAAMAETSPDLETKKKELAELIESINQEQSDKFQRMMTMASELRAIKLTSTGTGKAAPASLKVKEALRAAKEAVAAHGADSAEAKLAWETLEEIASSDNSEAMAGALSDEECSLEDAAMEACMALEELNRVLSKSK